ncbi:FMN-binding negative transcriptional regulator [Moritella sp. 24]|uniref:FMN-binding negative transcriptional regulator n=1 Tax=Moritella sp. 24 TaxID=2746230 RepID=UPI001BA71C89|nr:FMN-binding negative transcriptional regulator [Moritella sp. 24]QUM77050.1 FMN-binding negative transcriptional regulator [Moritella sp. 24]
MQLVNYDKDKGTENADLFTIIKQNPLATLVFVDAEQISHVSHIPCHFDADNHDLIAHVSNHHPLAKALKAMSNGIEGVNIQLVFHGDSHYMSPNDVAACDRTPKTVPTWRYSNAHVVGVAVEIGDTKEKFQQMVLTTAYFEKNKKTPWSMDKVSATAITHMLNVITVFKISIDQCKKSDN